MRFEGNSGGDRCQKTQNPLLELDSGTDRNALTVQSAIIAEDRLNKESVVSRKLERMVLALRQACIHPQIGAKGLGATKSPYRNDFQKLFVSSQIRQRKRRLQRRRMLKRRSSSEFHNDGNRTVNESSSDDTMESGLVSDDSNIDSLSQSDEGLQSESIDIPDGGINYEERRKKQNKKTSGDVSNEKAKKTRTGVHHQIGEVPKFMSTEEVLNSLMTEARVRYYEKGLIYYEIF